MIKISTVTLLSKIDSEKIPSLLLKSVQISLRIQVTDIHVSTAVKDNTLSLKEKVANLVHKVNRMSSKSKHVNNCFTLPNLPQSLNQIWKDTQIILWITTKKTKLILKLKIHSKNVQILNLMGQTMDVSYVKIQLHILILKREFVLVPKS